MKRSVLVLRYFLHLAVKFRSGSLINTARFSQIALSYCFQDTQYAGRIDICGEFRGIERYLYMALCGKVVYFVRLYLFHHLQDTHRVAEIGIVEVEIRMPLQVGDTLTVVEIVAL